MTEIDRQRHAGRACPRDAAAVAHFRCGFETETAWGWTQPQKQVIEAVLCCARCFRAQITGADRTILCHPLR